MKKAIIDIDGVLNYYPKTWLDFLNNEKGYNVDTLKEAKDTIPYNLYKKYKEEYRCSEYKNDAEVRANAQALFDTLHNKGYLIYVITARPLFKHNLLEKTILWLQKNNLKYDYIYCSQKKDFTIFEKFGHVDLVIEDNIDNLTKIRNINGPYDCKYYVISNQDNMEYRLQFEEGRLYNRRNLLSEIILEVLEDDEM